MRNLLVKTGSVFALSVAAASFLAQEASAASRDASVRACSVQNRPATVLEAAPIDTAPAQPPYAPRDAYVRIDLDESGAVVNASILQSSLNGTFDLAAVRAARSSKYQPEIQNCNAVAGSYVLIASSAS